LFKDVGRGGGIIKQNLIVVMLCALALVLCILPSAESLNNQNTLQNPTNIVSSGQTSVSHTNTLNKHANAASTYYVKYVIYKKVYKKVRYKYHGKYRYKWVVRYVKVYRYKKVSAATKIVKKSSIIAYGVKVTSKTVIATAKCSCGALGNYNFHTGAFVNYCPKCHKYGVLKWNPKGTAEGEWTCSACGADYCAACGKIKIKGSSIHLTKA